MSEIRHLLRTSNMIYPGTGEPIVTAKHINFSGIAHAQFAEDYTSLTLGAHAQRGLNSSWFVCLATSRSISDTSGFRTMRTWNPNDCVREIRREKQTKKPITLGSLPCTLEVQEVTTNGMYRLPHAIYCCN